MEHDAAYNVLAFSFLGISRLSLFILRERGLAPISEYGVSHHIVSLSFHFPFCLLMTWKRHCMRRAKFLSPLY